MKLKLIIIFFLIPLLSSCKKIADSKDAGHEDVRKFGNYSEVPCFGVVIASALNGRLEPKLNSQAKVTFQFGTPLVFVERTSLKENIDGKEDYWYREKETGVWFFGGFLVKTQFNQNLMYSFDEKSYKLNTVGGGWSYFYTFNAIVLNDIYVSWMYLSDYPENEYAPTVATVIGKCRITGDQIIFSNGVIAGAYDNNGKWINDLKLVKCDNQEHVYKEFKQRFKKESDEDGSYYVLENSSDKNKRSFYKKQVEVKKSTNEEIWYSWYEIEKKSINQLRDRIPFVKVNKK